MSKPELLLRVLIEITTILLACRAAGVLMRRIGQPQVMGEMIAGLVLGPSVFGLLAPGLQAAIFPAGARSTLGFMSQAGLALYMFGQGLEFEASLVSRRSATCVSLAGILAPLAVGGVLGVLMAQAGGFYAPGTSALQAALFMGSAMSITAFPVLARIVQERGLSGTRVGTLALAAGSIGDALAWCLFAIVISAFQGSRPGAALAFAGSSAGLALVLGSFVLGAVIPKGALNGKLSAGLGPVSSRLLVPLYFAYSGLHTRLALIDSWSLWGVTLIVFLAASVAKAIACGVAARRSGLEAREAAGLGMLMNARGLMELILLNIALEAGIITPTLFAIMSLMAILTTFVATPAFELTRWSTGDVLAVDA